MAGADKDIVKPFHQRVKKRYENIWLQTRVTAVEALDEGLKVTFEGDKAPSEPQVYDRILVSVGRIPNGLKLDADKAGVAVDERGFISVDSQQRTNIHHIFAIGDVVGQRRGAGHDRRSRPGGRPARPESQLVALSGAPP